MGRKKLKQIKHQNNHQNKYNHKDIKEKIPKQYKRKTNNK